MTAEPTDLLQQLRGRAAFCRDRGEVKTPELLEAAAQQLADAKAAQALVLMADDGPDLGAPSQEPSLRSLLYHHYVKWMLSEDAKSFADHYIRALADTDGLALVREQQELLEAVRSQRDKAVGLAETFEADRDRLAAANAALEAQVARLVGAVKEYHLALDRRQNGNTAGYRLQDEIQRILNMPWRQGAALAEVMADARREGGE